MDFYYKYAPILICIFLFAIKGDFSLDSQEIHFNNSRHPAASTGGNCSSYSKGIMYFLNNKKYNKLATMHVQPKFKVNYQKFKQYEDEYLDSLNAGTPIDELVVEPGIESTLAYIEALSKKAGLTELDFKEVRRINKVRLAKLANRLEKPNRLSFDNLEDILSDYFFIRNRIPRDLKVFINKDEFKQKILISIMQERIAEYGIRQFAQNYGIVKKGSGRFNTFVHSRIGRTFLTGLFNLPLMFGAPIVYFPKLSTFKLPREIALKILDEGLTDNNLKLIDEAVEAKYKDGWTTLANRERYNIIRRYVMTGASIFAGIYITWDVYHDNKEMAEERKAMEEAALELSNTLNSAEELEARGYRIFVSNEQENAAEVEDNLWCRELKDCLDLESEMRNEEITKDHPSYKECKEFIDPDNKCQSI